LRFGLQPQLRASFHVSPAWDNAVGRLVGFAAFEAPIHLFVYSAILGVTFIVDYSRRLRARETASAQLATQLAQAELQALRMQLNPHFLFNALNGVATLVRERKHDRAVRMLAGISDLLRYVLDESGKQEVQLRREVEFIAQYLEIERIRFPDRLRVRIDVDPESTEALVPNLILQPVVENAIRHGVARHGRATKLTITAQRNIGMLEVKVEDDGPGFGGSLKEPPSIGVGIENTRARLAQTYGEDQSLTFESLTPQGAAVTITIPFRTVALSHLEV
jgi:LytS/YehU family sensor histidine kinase